MNQKLTLMVSTSARARVSTNVSSFLRAKLMCLLYWHSKAQGGEMGSSNEVLKVFSLDVSLNVILTANRNHHTSAVWLHRDFS